MLNVPTLTELRASPAQRVHSQCQASSADWGPALLRVPRPSHLFALLCASMPP